MVRKNVSRVELRLMGAGLLWVLPAPISLCQCHMCDPWCVLPTGAIRQNWSILSDHDYTLNLRRLDSRFSNPLPSKKTLLMHVLVLWLSIGSVPWPILTMAANSTDMCSVTTLAGWNTSGFQDGNGTLTARFYGPSGIAALSTGNLVVADYWNRAIRTITMPTGSVNTLAGSNQSGFVDGTGAATRFWSPIAIATLPNGSVVVADQGNHAIRTILMPNGVVTTLAGASPPTARSGFVDGTGTAARLNAPVGIATLPNGSLVVADKDNHAIRIITLPNGVVSTLAGSNQSGFVDGNGTLTARFTNPCGIATLPNGSLVVADTYNHAIRIITLPNGVVSTLAGRGPPTGQSGFVDGTGTTARLNAPFGIATFPNGNLVVADSFNHAIRTISMPDGLVSTLAGKGPPTGQSGFVDGTGPSTRFNTPYGVATLPNGNLVVADTGNNAIRLITFLNTHSGTLTRSVTTTTTPSHSISWSRTASSSYSDTVSASDSLFSTSTVTSSSTLTGLSTDSHSITWSLSSSHTDESTASPPSVSSTHSHRLSGTETYLLLDGYLRTSNSTVELDSLLEVPTTFRGAVDRLSLPETQEVLRQRGRRRIISLEGDIFQPSLLLNGQRMEFMTPIQVSVASSSPSPASTPTLFEMKDKGGCWFLSTKTIALLDYIRANATVRILNSTSLQVDFDPIPMAGGDGSLRNDSHTQYSESQGSTAAALLSSMQTRDEWLTIRVAERCVTGHREPESLSLKLLRIPISSPPPQPVPAIQAARATLGVVQMVAAVNAGGVLAVTGSRSGVVLELFACRTDFDNRLDWMDNPFQISVGSQQYSQYLGASTMNHLLIYGVPALHALMGVVYSHIRCVSVWDGFVWARFPSLSLVPLQYLIETTAQSATIVATAAVSAWDRAIAATSLCLVVAPVVALLVYLTRTWGPQCIPGANPMTLARKSKKKNTSSLSHDLSEPLLHRPPGVKLLDIGIGPGPDQWLPSTSRAKLKLIIDSILFFIDGDISWKDSENCRPGYCRASRLLFTDYTPSAYWFMSVELGVAFLMGILGGIKVGTCDAVAIAILVVLLHFLVLLLAVRPYNTVFGVYFNIVVTVLQVLGAAFAVIALSRGGPDRIVYQERSELMSIAGLYLLIGKAVLDLLPKLRDLVVYVCRVGHEGLRWTKEDPPTTQSEASLGPGGTHNDLTEKLLQTIQASSAEDANWVSSINVVAEPVQQPMDEECEDDHRDEFDLVEDPEEDLPFPLPRTELPSQDPRHEAENWGYEWDESALALRVPTPRLLLEDDEREISLLKRLRPRGSNNHPRAEDGEECDGEDLERRESGSSPFPSLPRLDPIERNGNRTDSVPDQKQLPAI